MGCSTASKLEAFLMQLLFITCSYLQLPVAGRQWCFNTIYNIECFIRPSIDCFEGLEESLWLGNFVQQQSLLNCDMIEIFVCGSAV